MTDPLTKAKHACPRDALLKKKGARLREFSEREEEKGQWRDEFTRFKCNYDILDQILTTR